jgi:hypothetical protein
LTAGRSGRIYYISENVDLDGSFIAVSSTGVDDRILAYRTVEVRMREPPGLYGASASE